MCGTETIVIISIALVIFALLFLLWLYNEQTKSDKLYIEKLEYRIMELGDLNGIHQFL